MCLNATDLVKLPLLENMRESQEVHAWNEGGDPM